MYTVVCRESDGGIGYRYDAKNEDVCIWYGSTVFSLVLWTLTTTTTTTPPTFVQLCIVIIIVIMHNSTTTTPATTTTATITTQQQQQSSNTRLVTIAAHVDHGKTTLADCLLEYHGLIAEQRLVGTLRYLDSDPEEQRRGITMRASAIALTHTVTATTSSTTATTNSSSTSSSSSSNMISNNSSNNTNNNNNTKIITIHLVDSPGHSDFCREVSSALLACDTCLLVVDVVEGMAPRTHQVLREAVWHQLVPILVLNKIDRLCTDLGLSPTEAFGRLRAVLESVNAAAAAIVTSLKQQQQGEEEEEQTDTAASSYESCWTLDPAKGNVIFASALHGWGFTVPALARSLFRQGVIPMKPARLKPHLFGDVKWSSDECKLLKWKASQKQHDDQDQLPLFAQYGLAPLWKAYETRASDDQDALWNALQVGATGPEFAKILQQQQQQQQNSCTSSRPDHYFILRRYRPLATTVLDAVCRCGPSPAQASQTVRRNVLRLQEPLVSLDHRRHHQNVNKNDNNDTGMDNNNNNNNNDDAPFFVLQNAVRSCDASGPTVAQVCQLMRIDRAHIRRGIIMNAPPPPPEDDDPYVVLGLTRVLSGILRTGEEYYYYAPRNESPLPAQRRRTSIRRLYWLMGSSDLIPIDAVPAGHLCAVQTTTTSSSSTGISTSFATLCRSRHGTPLVGFLGAAAARRPLVKVQVEAVRAADTPALERGLAQLQGVVEVTFTPKGERLLACYGELHLEQSLFDLRAACGHVELRISDPIVDFGETTSWLQQETGDYKSFWDAKAGPPLRQMSIPPYNDEPAGERGRMRAILSGRGAAIWLRVVPLAPGVYRALQKLSEGDANERMVADEVGADGIDSHEAILELGRGLGHIQAEKNDSTDPETLLKQVQSLLCSMDASGNAIMESSGLKSGLCVKGVQSASGEIYVPKKDSLDKDKEESHFENGTSVNKTESRADYDSLRSCIRNHPDLLKDSNADNDAMCALDEAARRIWSHDMKGSAVAGFQMAVHSGWICEEPVRNVLVVLEGVEIALRRKDDKREDDSTGSNFEPSKPLSGGMVVSSLRAGIRSALLSRPARLVERHMRLTLHASLSGVGALYSVLNRRRGKVVDDSMVDGTDLLLITALIPQAESFGLAPELLHKTSGEVTAPELVFSHWEMLDVDPFWIPTSQEEREDFGEVQQSGDASTGMDNTALRYIRQVRERKGLVVDSSRTVVAAEKQRTLKR